jgi:hypothetical protein
MTAAIFIPLWIAFIVWLGIKTSSIELVLGAILATIFVLIKALSRVKI